MNLRQLYLNNATVPTKRTILQTFCQKFKISREQFYKVLDMPIQEMPTARAKFFAGYFSNGSIDKLLEITSNPNPKEVLI